jgi:HAD superfamily hydrolase (TIGR01509 family)
VASHRRFSWPESTDPIAVVFDCEGTLIDSEILHAAAIQMVLTRCGVELALDEIKRMSTGIDNGSLLSRIEEERAIALPSDLESTIEDVTINLMSGGVRLMDGALNVLHALDRSAVPIAIATNSTCRVIESAMAGTELSALFEGHLATRDQVAAPKPAPDVYVLAAELLGARCSHCLAVEDSPTGVKAASAAGMNVVGFCPPMGAYRCEELFDAGASAVVPNLRAILPYVYLRLISAGLRVIGPI